VGVVVVRNYGYYLYLPFNTKRMKDLLIAILGMALLCCLICGTLFSDSDCGNAKVVRDVEYIVVNQDSIDSAYYHHKADSIMSAIKNQHANDRHIDEH